MPEEPEQEQPGQQPFIDRRDFLAGLGYTSVGVAIGIPMGAGIPRLGDDDGDEPRAAAPQSPPAATPTATPGAEPPPVVPAIVQGHPRVRVATLSGLNVGEQIDFEYPTKGSPASLFRLGKAAAGGIGPDGDIVAFATNCTHMGCPLRNTYRPEHQILGPCACHFTTFALTHRGMVVLGQATENLPQIVLELDGDEIVAVGTLGILYGFRDNLADVPFVEGL